MKLTLEMGSRGAEIRLAAAPVLEYRILPPPKLDDAILK